MAGLAAQSQLSQLVLANQGIGAQVAVCDYGGDILFSESVGEDARGVSVTEDGHSQLYCLAKPAMARALIADDSIETLLRSPLESLLEVHESLRGQNCLTLLNHSACIKRVPLGAISILPREAALTVALQVEADTVRSSAGLAVYQDIIPWLIVDEVLSIHTHTGLYERVDDFWRANTGLRCWASASVAGQTSESLLTDGLLLGHDLLPLPALRHATVLGNRLPYLAVTGSAIQMANSMAQIGRWVEATAPGSELLLPLRNEDAPVDVDAGQFFGVGTTLGLEAYGVGEVGRGLVGHLGWAGSGAAWFDPERRIAACVRVFGLDFSGVDALRYRLRALMRHLLTTIAA